MPKFVKAGFETGLFHCTPRKNEAKIDADGLCPFFGWEEQFSVAGKIIRPRRWVLNPVFLSVDQVVSSDFIADLFDVDEVVVYRVCEVGLTLHPGPDGLGTFSVHEWIPPDQIWKDHIYDRRKENF